MIVQTSLIADSYFVSRTGVDALAGVSPVFPLISLVVAIAQGARRRYRHDRCTCPGAGRIGEASDYARYAVLLGVPLGLATTAVMAALAQPLRAHGRLRKCLETPSLFLDHFRAPR
jgi:Na+-driven multidrug efflux pump